MRECMFGVNGQYIYIYIYLCVWMSVVCGGRGSFVCFSEGAYEDTLSACSVQLRYIYNIIFFGLPKEVREYDNRTKLCSTHLRS